MVESYKTPAGVDTVYTGYRQVKNMGTSTVWTYPFRRYVARIENTVKTRTDHICLHLMNGEFLPGEKSCQGADACAGFVVVVVVIAK